MNQQNILQVPKKMDFEANFISFGKQVADINCRQLSLFVLFRNCFYWKKVCFRINILLIDKHLLNVAQHLSNHEIFQKQAQKKSFEQENKTGILKNKFFCQNGG